MLQSVMNFKDAASCMENARPLICNISEQIYLIAVAG